MAGAEESNEGTRARRGSAAWFVSIPILTLGTLFACSGSGEGDDSSTSTGTGSSNGSGDGDSGSAGAGSFIASESVARRLSVAELDNTLRDVFGDTSRPASRRLNEDSFDPFDNNYTLQIASAALIDSLDLLAEEVAQEALADSKRRDDLLPCQPEDPADADCFAQIVRHLGRRAFRRPLSDEEVKPYLSLLDFSQERSDFDVGVQLLIRSLIQDPEFLYRIEVGSDTADADVFVLDSYEIVTRMGYLLWGSTPDDDLLTIAEERDLTSAEERRELASDMLDDPRAREQLYRFHSMWLGYRAIPHPASLVSEFSQETSALIDEVIFGQDRSYLELFTSDSTYLTDALADHYGLPHPQDGQGWVEYGDSGRAGILSHGSVLSGFSKFSDTSPTQRGIFVQTRLMCNDIAPPPANVDVDQPPGDDEAACKEDRYAEHRALASCAKCHGLMDPIGLGLENYDIGGVYREHDDANPDCIISGEGDLPSVGPFSGPAQLGRMLVDEGFVDACAAEHYLSFALGRELQSQETQLLDETISSFRSDDHDLTNLIVEYIASSAFALRKEPQ